ncbi:HAEPLYID family protein [Chitinophaga rhizophila]|uniref:Transporter n=1 Tax=Chitinophaga rhizophila TaxID=2866212 RepID=A0ABS7G7H4_9BACT|nr:HAEPLYID family protein [Chitinophaga rhizophila]MBW8683589.1 hypothetical protein [Chitinophaga rhizophila]
MKRSLLTLLLFTYWLSACSQAYNGKKIGHVEPLQLDLIQDLDARNGDKEFEVDMETDMQRQYNELNFSLEYEQAIAERLGFEVQLPFSFYQPKSNPVPGEELPKNRMEGLKLGLQYTVAVLPAVQTSVAVAITHETYFHSFRTMKQKGGIMKGSSENIALIAAKRWGRHFHTMIHTNYEWMNLTGNKGNSYINHDISIHYQFERRYVLGLEYICRNNIKEEATIYPQARLALNKLAECTLAAQIPVDKTKEGIHFLVGLEIKL